MSLSVTQVHQNLQQRVTFLYLEFEDLFVVLGLAARTNVPGSRNGTASTGTT
jgi:hypothetical protein